MGKIGESLEMPVLVVTLVNTCMLLCVQNTRSALNKSEGKSLERCT